MGKSSLINCILGKHVCKVGNPANFIHDPEKAFLPQTSVVKGFDGDMNGVEVTVYDSPGLQDGMDNDQLYLDDMYEKCRDVDLVLYCHDITRVRWTGPEMESLRLITGKFGVTVWKKTILVFTKANCLEPAEFDVDEKKYLEDVIEVNKQSFQAALKKILQATGSASDKDSIIESLPAVPAGSERKQILPTGPFIGRLWITCMERLQDPKKTGTFMKATNYTKRVVLYTDIKDHGSSELPTREELSEAWLSKRGKVKSAVTSSEQMEESKYIVYMNKKNTRRFKKLADKCKEYASVIWRKVYYELLIFIPPGDD